MERRPLVEDIENYAQNIVDTVREPLLILDATLRVRSANRAFYQTFHVSPGETEGSLNGTEPRVCGSPYRIRVWEFPKSDSVAFLKPFRKWIARPHAGSAGPAWDCPFASS